MKPRFSILVLLGITAYVAVNVAAICDPQSIWMKASVVGWVLVLVHLTVVSLDVTKHQGVTVARAVLACALLYLFVCNGRVFQESVPDDWLAEFLVSIRQSYLDSETSGPKYEVLDGTTLELPSEYDDTKALFRQITVYNTSLAVGIVGGCVALWRHRRREQRENAGK